MISLLQARWLACSLLFLLSALSIEPIPADEAGVTTSESQEATGEAIPGSFSADKAFVIALADPAPPAPRSTSLAPSDLPSVSNSAWPTPARFFTINQVLAKHKQVASTSPTVHLAAIDPTEIVSDTPSTVNVPPQSDEPFGLFTFKAPEGHLWVKWHNVEADIQTEAPALARCRAEPDNCTPSAARFVAIINQAALRQGRARLEVINEQINAAIRYTSDMVQWGAPDVWSAPLDLNNRGSFNTGLGDCEDYAIAKYVALREAGVAAGDLRLLLVRDNAVRLDHAVLAARDNGRWLILDNRWARLIDDTEAKQFLPLFAVNEQGVKLFAAPYALQRPASSKTIDIHDQLFATGADATELNFSP